MTVDMRPPIPGTATSALSVLPQAYPAGVGVPRVGTPLVQRRRAAVAAPLEGERVATDEAAGGARDRAPTRAALQHRVRDALGDPAHAGDARVEAQAGDDRVGVTGVG